MLSLRTPRLIRAPVSQRQARAEPLPFQGLFTQEKANVGQDPVHDLSRMLVPQTCSLMPATRATASPQETSPHQSSSSTPSANPLPHHASEGRVRGAEALQTLRQACEKALYWGYSEEEQGHLPLPAPTPS